MPMNQRALQRQKFGCRNPPPARVLPKGELPAQYVHMTAPHSPGRPLRVLVADDNPLNLRLATRILREMGHSGVLVTDGAKALQALRAQAFDLALLDVTMPGTGGLEALAELRHWERQGRARTAVIMVTAYDTPEDRRRLLDAGADGYVAKPIDAERLGAEIQRVLGARC
jgi:CheY-like chemotaxis protein